MKSDALSLWIQAGTAMAAVAAAIIALVVSALDRRNARKIAAQDRELNREIVFEDRTAALRQSQLLFEQQALLRLLENARRGGSTDHLKRSDLGTEAAALIGLFGPERLPRNWSNRVAKTPEELRQFVDDPTKEDWLRNSVEIQLALDEVTEQIRSLLVKQM